MASKLAIKSRDPAKVAALRAVIDKAYYREVEILDELIAQPLPNFGSPTSPKEWQRAASASSEKDMTFRANAAAARSNSIKNQTLLCVTLLDATPDFADEVKDDNEDRGELVRNVIAAVRGQMDPTKIKEFERELGESLDEEE